MTTKPQPTEPARKGAGHTPGPWTFTESGSMVYAVDYKPESKRVYGHGFTNQGFICDLNDGEYHEYTNPEEQLANARLIAASPDLLQACQRMATGASRTRADYPDDELFKHTMHYLKALDAAISKATGTTNKLD